MVLVQLDAASGYQKPVDTVAGPGKPQAPALDYQVKSLAGIDQAALGGQEAVRDSGWGHGASPWVGSLLSPFASCRCIHTEP
jgi:hypothetical protein